jgi:hypothetical protein
MLQGHNFGLPEAAEGELELTPELTPASNLGVDKVFYAEGWW